MSTCIPCMNGNHPGCRYKTDRDCVCQCVWGRNAEKGEAVTEARNWAFFWASMWKALTEDAMPPPAPEGDPPYWMTRSLSIPDIDVVRDLHRAIVKARLRETEKSEVVIEDDISALQQHELEVLHAINKALTAVHSLGGALKECRGRFLDAETR